MSRPKPNRKFAPLPAIPRSYVAYLEQLGGDRFNELTTGFDRHQSRRGAYGSVHRVWEAISTSCAHEVAPPVTAVEDAEDWQAICLLRTLRTLSAEGYARVLQYLRNEGQLATELAAARGVVPKAALDAGQLEQAIEAELAQFRARAKIGPDGTGRR